jgi:hypothetical protein
LWERYTSIGKTQQFYDICLIVLYVSALARMRRKISIKMCCYLQIFFLHFFSLFYPEGWTSMFLQNVSTILPNSVTLIHIRPCSKHLVWKRSGCLATYKIWYKHTLCFLHAVYICVLCMILRRDRDISLNRINHLFPITWKNLFLCEKVNFTCYLNKFRASKAV